MIGGIQRFQILAMIRTISPIKAQNLNTMSAEPGVIKEAERLYSKFGGQAVEVAKEMKKVNAPIEHFFWDLVVAYLNDMRRANAK